MNEKNFKIDDKSNSMNCVICREGYNTMFWYTTIINDNDMLYNFIGFYYNNDILYNHVILNVNSYNKFISTILY